MQSARTTSVKRSTPGDDVKCCASGALWAELKEEVLSQRAVFQLCCVALQKSPAQDGEVSGTAVRRMPGSR